MKSPTPPQKTGKKKTVKAWAVIIKNGKIENGDALTEQECPAATPTETLGIFEFKKTADEKADWYRRYDGRYSVVPCTITYSL